MHFMKTIIFLQWNQAVVDGKVKGGYHQLLLSSSNLGCSIQCLFYDILLGVVFVGG